MAGEKWKSVRKGAEMNRGLLSCAALACFAGAAIAEDVSNVRLFGQWYKVQRFDVSEEIKWPDPINLGFDMQMIESEGIAFRSNNEIFFSTGDGGTFGSYANWVVRAKLNTDIDGFPTGFEYVNTLVVNDLSISPFDLNPNGVALAGPTGLAAGGVLVADGESLFVRGYSNSGALLGGFGVGPTNTNMEDLTYVTPLKEIWTVKQEPDPAQVVRFSETGALLGTFPIATTLDPANLGEAKGMSFFPPSAKNPAFFDGQADGYVIVALDENNPWLQAFDLEGNKIGDQPLTDTGTSGGVSLLDLGPCSLQLLIESLTVDAETGRIFLQNQGNQFDCNYVFVMTPFCRADISRDGSVDFGDFLAFFNGFDNSVVDEVDINGSGDVDFGDFLLFFNGFDAGC
jgi:hypothetical protein